MKKQVRDLGGIIYSQYGKENKSGEDFIKEHTLGYIISGNLLIIDGNKTHTLREGEVMLYRKNNLAKFIKQPSDQNEFVAIHIVLDNDTLMNFNKGQLTAKRDHSLQDAVLSIRRDNLLINFFNSLMAYFDEDMVDGLAQNKKQEVIMLLLRSNPKLKDVLFDFGVPGKIDLELFMIRNYRYNVTLEKLAYLTGRSLATFKRDFEKTFNTSPNRWIQQQRLKQAHYLISEKKVKPSDVYLEVGFESLSHFSFAFKQFFGQNPSSL